MVRFIVATKTPVELARHHERMILVSAISTSFPWATCLKDHARLKSL
jgi:hypothetical protein